MPRFVRLVSKELLRGSTIEQFLCECASDGVQPTPTLLESRCPDPARRYSLDPFNCGVCGDNPLTPEADPFVCNAKLVGARASTVFYDAATAQGLVPPDTYPGSARDGDGHGTHTATTAAGSRVEQSPILGVSSRRTRSKARTASSLV